MFRDAQSCAEAVARGERSARDNGHVRLVAWNVRWFPDGQPGKQPKRNGGTNVPWLACALTWLDADVVVLEEIKRAPHAVDAANALLAELQRLTGATWSLAVDDCVDPYRQHIAFVWRTDRVSLVHIATRGEIDPTTDKKGTPSCPGVLRPGLSGYVKSLRGKADFHVVGVHLDSGKEARDYGNRQSALASFGPLKKTLAATAADTDVVIMGDFNTMGGAGISATDERARLPQTVREQGYRLTSESVACTEYYRDRGTPLDHALVSLTMQEAASAIAHTEGPCAALSCKPLDALFLPSQYELSDHCPLVLDVVDKDLD